MNNAVADDARLKKSALEILMEKGTTSDCVCDHQYRNCAAEILENNDINDREFKLAVHNALLTGRKKRNNVVLIGPSKLW